MITLICKANDIIKMKIKDISGFESDRATLAVTLPYIYRPLVQFLEQLFQRFPHAFPLFQQLMEH